MAPYKGLKNSSTASKYHAPSPSPTFLQSGLSSFSQESLSPRNSARIASSLGDSILGGVRTLHPLHRRTRGDFLDVVQPLVLWPSFGSGPGVGANRVPVPLDSPGVISVLLTEGHPSGAGGGSTPSSVAILFFPPMVVAIWELQNSGIGLIPVVPTITIAIYSVGITFSLSGCDFRGVSTPEKYVGQCSLRVVS